MRRYLYLVYGATAYAGFLVVFTYAMAFVGNVLVPKGIDSGPAGPLVPSVLINVGLLGLFAVQHTIMARPGFKAWWTRIIPPVLERSTFVVAASVLLALICWQWQPITAVVWEVQATPLRWLLLGVYAAGVGVALASTFLIDHFDLFGLRQVVLHFRGRPYSEHPFRERGLYRVVRHPLMLGLLLAFWAAPTMTAGHLLFALVTTTYILIGIQLEERDLARHLGARYAEYRRRVPMLLPLPRRHTVKPPAGKRKVCKQDA